MKCKKCAEPAVINMRQHRLALCASHFLEWVPAQVERTIRAYRMFERDDKVLVAVSGGKDSLSLWDILLYLGYQADGLYIQLGISDGDYSALSLEKCQAFAAERGANLQVFNVRERYGKSIPEVARAKRGRSTCAVCGLIKRHIMNQAAYEGGYAALATGHNVDDEAAILLENVLRWQTGYLERQGPVLPSIHPRLARKVRPLVRLYEREMAAYAVVRGIDYIYDECPYAKGATTLFYKELLNRLEERSRGTKLQFYQHFLRAREAGRIFPRSSASVEFHECEACSQPTTVPGLCAFCRLWVTE